MGSSKLTGLLMRLSTVLTDLQDQAHELSVESGSRPRPTLVEAGPFERSSQHSGLLGVGLACRKALL